MIIVYMSIRTRSVAEQPGKYNRPTGGTTCRGTIGVVKTYAFRSQMIKMGGFNYIISIGPQSIRSVIIGNKEYDVGPGCGWRFRRSFIFLICTAMKQTPHYGHTNN